MNIPEEENTVLVVEVETLYSGATMHLLNQDTKEKTKVSVSIVRRLNPNLFATVSNEVLEEISRKRFATYDPVAGSDNLVRVNSVEHLKMTSFDDYEGDMILKKEDANKTENDADYFTPYLLWSPMARYESFQLADAEENLADEGEGTLEDSWILSLMGFSDMVLGEANWDDHEAISKLITMMDDVESLSVIAGLQNSQLSEQVTTFNSIKDILANIEYPKDCSPLPDRSSSLIAGSEQWNRSLAGKIANAIASLYPTVLYEEEQSRIDMQMLTLDEVEFAYGFKMLAEPKTKAKIFQRSNPQDTRTQLLGKLAEIGLFPIELNMPDGKYFWVSLLKEDEVSKLLKLPVADCWEQKSHAFQFERRQNSLNGTQILD